MYSHPIIGIDLGTTYSALATINPAGKPEIVANQEGERTTASAVHFQEDGTLTVGQLAVDAAGWQPERVARWVKRQMGDPNWRFEVDGTSYTAVDISAVVLKKVRQDAEVTVGPIEHAVISVPAYFDEVRRKATMDAAEKAGIEVLRIINEPTAAALAYATGGHTSGTVLVYDFGGGTFDVSVVEIRSPNDIVVVASEGDHRLGGHDLDKRLAAHLDGQFQAEYGVPLMPEGDEAAYHNVLTGAEKAKCQLSIKPKSNPVHLNWGGHTMNVQIERPTLEDLVGDELTRTEMLVDNALTEANIRPDQIDHVILVGGSTRIPAVQELLRKKFGKDPLRGVNPDEAVALGAAIQAGMLAQERGLAQLPEAAAASLSQTRLQDVTNHSYGTISIGEAHGRDRLRNTIMIPKNSQIPCSRTKSFYTATADQREVQCQITQGEDEDPEFVTVMAEGSLPLPPGRPANCEVRVTYSYDANQRMSCEFLDVESGETRRFEMDMSRWRDPRGVAANLDEASFDDLVIE